MLFTTWVSRIFKLLIPNFCDFFEPSTYLNISQIPNPRVSKFHEYFNQSESEQAKKIVKIGNFRLESGDKMR